jgi:hypothetical protein
MATMITVSQASLPWPQSSIAQLESLRHFSLSSPTPIDKNKPSPLLALPPELRIRIYSLVLTKTSQRPSRPNYSVLRNMIGRVPTSLLLVNKQVYSETRLIPFQTNSFDFYGYFESSLYCCRTWCQRLQEWQLKEVRCVTLMVVERDLSGADWTDVCAMLGGSLRELVLEVREDADGNGKRDEMLFSREASWIVNGLAKLRLLWKLLVKIPIPVSSNINAIVGTVEIGNEISENDRSKPEVLSTLNETLHSAVPWCSNIVVMQTENKPPLTAAKKMEQVFVW